MTDGHAGREKFRDFGSLEQVIRAAVVLSEKKVQEGMAPYMHEPSDLAIAEGLFQAAISHATLGIDLQEVAKPRAETSLDDIGFARSLDEVMNRLKTESREVFLNGRDNHEDRLFALTETPDPAHPHEGDERTAYERLDELYDEFVQELEPELRRAVRTGRARAPEEE